MSHEFSIRVEYKPGFCYKNKLIQNKKCKIKLTLQNKGANIFPGGSLGQFNIGHISRIGTYSTLAFTNRTIPILQPLEKIIFYTEDFLTYFSDHCYLELNVSASDNQPVNINATTPILKDSPQSKPNILFVTCFIESEDSVASGRLAISNFLLSIVATFATLAALKISFDQNNKISIVRLSEDSLKQANTYFENSISNSMKEISTKITALEKAILLTNTQRSKPKAKK